MSSLGTATALKPTQRAICRQLVRVVLTCFDIFEHHRRSGKVDKIKKYRPDEINKYRSR